MSSAGHFKGGLWTSRGAPLSLEQGKPDERSNSDGASQLPPATHTPSVAEKTAALTAMRIAKNYLDNCRELPTLRPGGYLEILGRLAAAAKHLEEARRNDPDAVLEWIENKEPCSVTLDQLTADAL